MNIAITCNHIGNIYFELWNPSEAGKFYDRSYSLYRTLFGKGHQKAQSINNKIKANHQELDLKNISSTKDSISMC